MGQDGNLHLEEGGVDLLPEVLLVTLVVRMGDQSPAGCQEFRPGGLDVDGGAVLEAEGNPVVEAVILTRLELGLGHGGLEGHVPESGGLLLVGLAPGKVSQEGLLGHPAGMLADGVVGLRPVD